MILLSRRSLNAVAAVVDVALHARPTPVTAKALAARHQLAPRHLETVLQALVRSGILKGMRGPRGGYELARERRRVSVGDIVRAAQTGPDPEGGAAASAPPLLTGVIGPALAEAGDLYLRALDAITVEDLCRRADRAAARSGGPVDFTI